MIKSAEKNFAIKYLLRTPYVYVYVYVLPLQRPLYLPYQVPYQGSLLPYQRLPSSWPPVHHFPHFYSHKAKKTDITPILSAMILGEGV